MNSSLSDEILSLNAIYGPETLIPSPSPSASSPSSQTTTTCILHIPNQNISLRLSFPQTYPDEHPEILGPASSGSDARKGEASEIAQLARDVLKRCFQPGSPCLFDLLTELDEALAELRDRGDEEVQIVGSPNTKDDMSTHQHDLEPADTAAAPPPNWSLSAPVTEKKSTFLARACRVTSVSAAKAAIAHLLATDKKVARATHNITAWRIRDANSEATYQDCYDDGETAAGGRLLHLLQVMDVWDVVVVVSRWYGGIHLGADRFKLIGVVGREAVVMGGFDRK